MSLCVFTTGNDLALLRESCRSVMITLHEYESKWTDYVEVKLRKGIEFLTHRQEQYFMWVDGHDSLIMKPAADILARLSAMGNPVLVAGEMNCWPDADRKEDYHKLSSNVYRISNQPAYINAGGYIGHRDKLLTVMHTVLAHATGGDDQRAWTSAYLAGMIPDVQIDYSRFIFSSVGDGDIALHTNSCVLHWNGKIPGRQEYWEANCGSTN